MTDLFPHVKFHLAMAKPSPNEISTNVPNEKVIRLGRWRSHRPSALARATDVTKKSYGTKFFQNLKISIYKSVGPPRAPPQARFLEMRSEVHPVLLFYHATFRLV